MSYQNAEVRALWWRGVLALVAGIGLSRAFAPYHWTALAPLALALLYSVAVYTPRQGAFRTGFAFGAGYFGFGVYWIYNSIHLFGEQLAPFAWAFTALFIAVLALFPAVQLVLFARFRRGRADVRDALLFTGLWGVSEFARSKIMGGFPWIALGYSQTDTPLAALAPLVGVYGISVIVCVLVVLPTALLLSHGPSAAAPRWRQWMVSALVIVPVAGLIWFAHGSQYGTASGRVLNVRIVQGNIPQSIKFDRNRLLQSMQDYQRLSAEALPDQTDLIIWPETAIPTGFERVESAMQPFLSALAQRGVTVLSGGFDHDGEYSYNSVRMLGSEQMAYRKRHLVPFGEYLPFRSVLKPLADTISFPVPGQVPWDGPHEPLTFGSEHLGVSICYEDVYGEEMRPLLPQAGILVNVSNDAWFGDSSAPHQHEQKARMRALEFSRPMIRVTNTGVSSFIGPDGRVIARIDYDRAGWLDQVVESWTGETPYVRLGNGPAWIASLVALLLGVSLGSNRDRSLRQHSDRM